MVKAQTRERSGLRPSPKPLPTIDLETTKIKFESLVEDKKAIVVDVQPHLLSLTLQDLKG